MSGGDSTALLRQAVSHHQAGRLVEAAGLYSRVLEQSPDHADALYMSGVCASQRGRLAEAETSFRRAVALKPGHDQAPYALANVLYHQGRRKEALPYCEQALEKTPGNHAARHLLGVLFIGMEAPDQAESHLRRAISLEPSEAGYHSNLGIALKDQDKFHEAETALRRALELKPDFPEALGNLGLVLRRLGRLRESEESVRRALELDPGYVEAHSNLGHVLMARGEAGDAEKAFRRAVALRPDYADAHNNLGIALLLMGQFAEGWAEHEWRWRKEDIRRRPFPQASWDGSPLTGKTILVWGEQGIGDELQFAGMVPELTAQGAPVFLESDPRLVPLFARSFPEATCLGKSDPPDSSLLSGGIDYQIPLAGLARFLRPDLKSFPKHKGYLKADPDQTDALRERYGGDGSFLVGVSWGSTDPKRPEKVLPLSGWRPLLKIPGVTFVNLQYGDTADERTALTAGTEVEIFHDETVDPLVDLDGFAAQVTAMDLVVSICNSTIHMAGALGVPGWVLVPFVPDWRWLLDREDSPWYPSLRLYRQRELGDWKGVMTEVSQALRRKVAER